jgi:hypothetical protein
MHEVGMLSKWMTEAIGGVKKGAVLKRENMQHEEEAEGEAATAW